MKAIEKKREHSFLKQKLAKTEEASKWWRKTLYFSDLVETSFPLQLWNAANRSRAIKRSHLWISTNNISWWTCLGSCLPKDSRGREATQDISLTCLLSASTWSPVVAECSSYLWFSSITTPSFCPCSPGVVDRCFLLLLISGLSHHLIWFLSSSIYHLCKQFSE